MTDWRGLCEELLGSLENEGHAHWPGGPDGDPLIERARLALAQPEPEDDVAQLRATLEATAAQRRAEDDARALLAQAEPEVRGPSDEELLRLAREWNSGYESIEFEFITDFARAVLARYGRPTPAPAGEAGELARSLHNASDALRSYALHGAAEACTRAADLLEQRHPAPVPVAERPWEREGWCDQQGRCWMGHPGGGEFVPSWRLCRPEDAPNMKVSLPANALPLPAGKVES